ncbi:MAG: hypothetical protein JXA73_18090 [Acidobacteria bacterium]|nr:hypothetical protein [Acidobacteriota bacterium]
MPTPLVHLGATVLCAHGGQATPMMPNSRVLVSGQPIAVMTSPYVVAGCPFNVSGSPVPCVSGQWVRAALRVFAGSAPVILMDSQAICSPNGTPLFVVSTQTRVSGT